MEKIKDHAYKRPVLEEPELSIICQKDTKQKAVKASSDHLEYIDSTRHLRLKLQSYKFQDATDQLTALLQWDLLTLFAWHKVCKSNYMSKSKIGEFRMHEQKGMTYQNHLHWYRCLLHKMSVYVAEHRRLTGISATFVNKIKRHYLISHDKWKSATKYWKLHIMSNS